jgi:hypothetical protein
MRSIFLGYASDTEEVTVVVCTACPCFGGSTEDVRKSTWGHDLLNASSVRLRFN